MTTSVRGTRLIDERLPAEGHDLEGGGRRSCGQRARQHVDAGGLGAAGGAIAGRYAASSGELPPVVVLAASPTTLYLMTSTNAKGIILAKHLTVLETMDRADVSVEIKQKATVRTCVITDESTGHEYKVEGKRILFHHMNDMLDALLGEDTDDETGGETS